MAKNEELKRIEKLQKDVTKKDVGRDARRHEDKGAEKSKV